MKKLLLIALIITIISGIYIYLNRSYAFFYNFLAQNRLSSPPHEMKITLGNNLNEQVLSFGNKQTYNYVALGDSLTAGLGASDYKYSFPYLLTQKLSAKRPVTLINLARSGDTSADVLNTQLPRVTSLKPDLITLLIGTNDIHNLISLEKFDSNYRQIVTDLKKTTARIYLFTIPYLGSDKIIYPPYNLLLKSRTEQFNQVIIKIAADFKVEYIDLYSLEKKADFYSADEFHPGDQGYKEWVKAINVD